MTFEFAIKSDSPYIFIHTLIGPLQIRDLYGCIMTKFCSTTYCKSEIWLSACCKFKVFDLQVALLYVKYCYKTPRKSVISYLFMDINELGDVVVSFKYLIFKQLI